MQWAVHGDTETVRSFLQLKCVEPHAPLVVPIPSTLPCMPVNAVWGDEEQGHPHMGQRGARGGHECGWRAWLLRLQGPSSPSYEKKGTLGNSWGRGLEKV